MVQPFRKAIWHFLENQVYASAWKQQSLLQENPEGTCLGLSPAALSV